MTKPKLRDQLKSLGSFVKDTVKDVAAGESIKVDPEQATRRYNLCLACPFLDRVKTKCQKCGCNMGRKVQWSAAKCADEENQRW
jgi:hypothetical protein